MENLGILKSFDDLGRLVIPKEMRDLFGFEKTVEVVVTTEGVLLRNPQYILVKKKMHKKEKPLPSGNGFCYFCVAI